MDEVSFGPRRESRLPPRVRRALAAVAAATAVTAAGAVLVTNITDAGRAASPAPRAAAAQPACPPAQTTKPNLAALPAGMRPGALQVVVAAQFSGQCGAGR